MREILHQLHFLAPLSPVLKAHLQSILKKKEYKKGEIILAEKEVCHSILYIQKGLIRSYYMQDKKEVSNWFMKEGDFCISVRSFLQQKPATDTLIALERCICWVITYIELEETYRLCPEFNIHGRLILSKYYCKSEERNMALKRQSPKNKYEQLMEKDPGLVLRVKNKHMASYLDVSLRTYVLIRKAYHAKRKK